MRIKKGARSSGPTADTDQTESGSDQMQHQSKKDNSPWSGRLRSSIRTTKQEFKALTNLYPETDLEDLLPNKPLTLKTPARSKIAHPLLPVTSKPQVKHRKQFENKKTLTSTESVGYHISVTAYPKCTVKMNKSKKKIDKVTNNYKQTEVNHADVSKTLECEEKTLCDEQCKLPPTNPKTMEKTNKPTQKKGKATNKRKLTEVYNSNESNNTICVENTLNNEQSETPKSGDSGVNSHNDIEGSSPNINSREFNVDSGDIVINSADDENSPTDNESITHYDDYNRRSKRRKQSDQTRENVVDESDLDISEFINGFKLLKKTVNHHVRRSELTFFSYVDRFHTEYGDQLVHLDGSAHESDKDSNSRHLPAECSTTECVSRDKVPTESTEALSENPQRSALPAEISPSLSDTLTTNVNTTTTEIKQQSTNLNPTGNQMIIDALDGESTITIDNENSPTANSTVTPLCENEFQSQNIQPYNLGIDSDNLIGVEEVGMSKKSGLNSPTRPSHVTAHNQTDKIVTVTSENTVVLNIGEMCSEVSDGATQTSTLELPTIPIIYTVNNRPINEPSVDRNIIEELYHDSQTIGEPIIQSTLTSGFKSESQTSHLCTKPSTTLDTQVRYTSEDEVVIIEGGTKETFEFVDLTLLSDDECFGGEQSSLSDKIEPSVIAAESLTEIKVKTGEEVSQPEDIIDLTNQDSDEKEFENRYQVVFNKKMLRQCEIMGDFQNWYLEVKDENHKKFEEAKKQKNIAIRNIRMQRVHERYLDIILEHRENFRNCFKPLEQKIKNTQDSVKRLILAGWFVNVYDVVCSASKRPETEYPLAMARDDVMFLLEGDKEKLQLVSEFMSQETADFLHDCETAYEVKRHIAAKQIHK